MPVLNLPRLIPPKKLYVEGFKKGLNTLQDDALISDNELSDAKNCIYLVDGIQKRTGTLNFGSESGSRVVGGAGFYTSATSDNRFMLRMSGTAIQYMASGTPTNISGATFTINKKTEMVIARDKMYVQNGTDAMVEIAVSGGAPAATTYTALATPANLTVTPTGATGATRYSYRVSGFNASGETLAIASVAITNGNATLDTTNYNALNWNDLAGATGYNVYGRKGTADNGIGETLLDTVVASAYNDQGQSTPSAIFTPAEDNTTGGVVGAYIIFGLSRLFVAGVTANPSRLYYSAGGTNISNFSPGYGGGWVDIAKNDGDKITGIAFYRNAIIVFKERSTWKFSFTTSGLPQLELVSNELGCISHRSICAVNNALMFASRKDGRLQFQTLGNQANFPDVLRSNERSVKIASPTLLGAANTEYLENATAIYFRNLYICCVAQGDSTTNSQCYVLDTRFGAWAYWDGIAANKFFTYTDSSGQEELYFASDTTGYVVQMFTGTNDNGTAISWLVSTKNFMLGTFDTYKIYRNPILWFKDVSNGSITGYIIADGLFSSSAFNISPLVSGVGFGFDKFGLIKFGTSAGAAASTAQSDQPMELQYTKKARGLKFNFTDANTASSFKFLGLSFQYIPLIGAPLPGTNRIRVT